MLEMDLLHFRPFHEPQPFSGHNPCRSSVSPWIGRRTARLLLVYLSRS